MALLINRFLAESLLWILAYHTILVLSGSSDAIIGDADDIPDLIDFVNPINLDPNGLYLNIDRPATCNGTVSTVRYCYYGDNTVVQRTYRSLVAVYRPVNNGHYEKISETISVTKRSYPFQIAQADAYLAGFNCDLQKLTSSIQVMEGDIIGACIYSSRNTSQLDMITVRLFAGYRMMIEGADSAGCDTGVMPSVVGDLLQQDSTARILHISAEINLASDLTITTQPLFVTREAETGELGRTTVTIVAIIVGGVLSTALVTLLIVIMITVSCWFVVHRRQKRSNENTLNVAYNARRDQSAMDLNEESEIYSGNDSNLGSSAVYYDYISNGSQPVGSRRQ